MTDLRNSLRSAPIGEMAERYLAWCAAAGYAAETVRARRGYLRHFRTWMERHRVKRLSAITAVALETYQVAVHGLRTRDGRRIGAGAVTQRLLAARGLLRWATRHGTCAAQLSDVLVLPRARLMLPRRVLSAAEVERLLALPDVTTTLGCRDRAVLELLYSTGVRRAELAALQVTDVHPDRGTAFICQGKGRRDRVVPVGRRALTWIGRYLAEARPLLARGGETPELFLSARGNRWRAKHLGARVRWYLWRAGVPGPGGCHVLRHTMATLMLEGGADIRHLQAILGHARLNTTALYTQVEVGELCRVHSRCHPAARMEPTAAPVHCPAGQWGVSGRTVVSSG